MPVYGWLIYANNLFPFIVNDSLVVFRLDGADRHNIAGVWWREMGEGLQNVCFQSRQ